MTLVLVHLGATAALLVVLGAVIGVQSLARAVSWLRSPAWPAGRPARQTSVRFADVERRQPLQSST